MSEEENIQLTTEDKASDKGWTPKEQWDGDPDLWVDAGEFLRRGELMDRISEQTRQLRSSQSEITALKEGLEVLTNQNKKIAEQEYKKALNTLKAEKASALDEGDNKKVIEIDDQIDELKEARKELQDSDQTKNVPNGPNNQQFVDPYVSQWETNNEWYSNNVAMRGAADALVIDYVNRNPQSKGNFKEILDYVDANIHQHFQNNSSSNKRTSATIDSNVSGSTGKKTTKSSYRLSPEQRLIAQKFVDQGIMSMDDYVKQLKEIGEI